MSKKETVKRYILFIICLFFMGLGVALTKHHATTVAAIVAGAKYTTKNI